LETQVREKSGSTIPLVHIVVDGLQGRVLNEDILVLVLGGISQNNLDDGLLGIILEIVHHKPIHILEDIIH